MAVFKDAPSFGPRTSLKQRMDKADAWIKLTPEQKTASVKKKYATLTPKQKEFLNGQQIFLTEVAPLLIPGAAGVKFAARLGSRVLPGIQKFFNFATKPKAKTKSITQRPPNKLPSTVTRIPKNQKPSVEDEIQRIAKNTPGLSKEDLFLYKQLLLAGAKLPVKAKPKKTPIPGSEHFSRMLSSAPKSNVVKIPKKKPQNQQITKQDVDDYNTIKNAKSDLSKTDNILDFPFERIKPPKKARGGKIKKKYSRGGGIRKPKW